MTTIAIRRAGSEDAATVLELIHSTFAGRPVLDPPSNALEDDLEAVTAELALHGGLVAEVDGHPAGSLLFRPHGRWLGLRRVGVLVEARHHGVAHHLAERAAEIAQAEHFDGLVLEAREELPDTVRFWVRNGYAEVGRDGPRLRMARQLPRISTLPGADDTRAFGVRLGEALGAGDLVVLTGELGAGKTTLAQGLGAGLRVRGPITSPTFVIARVHPSLVDGPALVHVDAYRLGDRAELDDLDLDTDLDDAVTIVEWGSGLAEALAGSRLEIDLERAPDDVRTARVTAVGPRWFEEPPPV
ncbi:tRNA (adenosine(37)-N6)-threonylcarbamoyltransferase complex ATPase subunit type 1 TsaE [Nocardioides terrisoli]|uniref:tRNA (adenosine(37)-N6)-threonylcarbamoyltransferase complex ATPase subunit type 1 TsaE n=1 Tax=Nocardioides terrisoli TaxID=3388267 RepID=UPI00287B628C|nr:tRNA (adenosine(37)-N6)-threonylcarbamoyltransferase complex ATPase subunit type 1 TsaE [Nocardioides marmorisolisilvae]